MIWLVLACLSMSLAMPSIKANDITSITREAGYEVSESIAPKASIVVNAANGQILWGDNIDLQRDPASTTKTMVIYLTMNAIKEGKISMDTEVVATANDQAIADIYELSNNKIKEGVTYTVSELLTMTLVPSSNIATLMLAHLIHDGDDASFIALMNQTAEELGMTNTIFHNGTGAIVEAFQGYYAPAGYDHTIHNLTTVKDLATLAYHLVNEHPEILDFTNDTVVTVKKGTPYEETFESYNHSLPDDPMGIAGVDGIKTGSSPSAGYNAIITAKRDGVRLITVVLGASQWGDPQGEFVRHYYVNALLEKTFKDYEERVVLGRGKQEINGKTYGVDGNLSALVLKNEASPAVEIEDGYAIYPSPKGYLPVAHGVKVGKYQPCLIAPSQKDKANQFFSKLPEFLAILALAGFGLFCLLFLLAELKRRKGR